MKYKMKSNNVDLSKNDIFVTRHQTIQEKYFTSKDPDFFSVLHIQVNFMTVKFLDSINYKNPSLHKEYSALRRRGKTYTRKWVQFMAKVMENDKLVKEYDLSGINTNSNDIKHEIRPPNYTLKQTAIFFYNNLINIMARGSNQKFISRKFLVDITKKSSQNSSSAIKAKKPFSHPKNGKNERTKPTKSNTKPPKKKKKGPPNNHYKWSNTVKDSYFKAKVSIKSVDTRSKTNLFGKTIHKEVLVKYSIHPVAQSDKVQFTKAQFTVSIDNEIFTIKQKPDVLIVKMEPDHKNAFKLSIQAKCFYKVKGALKSSHYSINTHPYVCHISGF